jgi:hypothetical protein
VHHRAVIAVVAAALCTASTASAARQPELKVRGYRVVSADGSITVQFHGDGSPTCQLAGRCGYGGTLLYTFTLDPSGDDPGKAFLYSVSGRRAGFSGSFAVAGRLDASVAADGNPTPCLDSVTREYEAFEAVFRGSGRSATFESRTGRPEAASRRTIISRRGVPARRRPTSPDVGRS